MQLTRHQAMELANTLPRVTDGRAKSFPDVPVGGKLWSGDMEDGFYFAVVIAKNDRGHCQIVHTCEFNDKQFCETQVAGEHWHATVKECLEQALEWSTKYHKPRMARCAAAQKVLDDGGDLEAFAVGLTSFDD